MLIKNKSFKKIFKHFNIPSEYDPIKYPYVGLGNPDANLLLVGSEKKNEKEFPIIYQHELVYNYAHWSNLVKDYLNYKDALHPKLKLRGGELNHFNPFSPLTLDETCNVVYKKGNHTYKRIETIINNILLTFHSLPPKSIFNISPYKYDDSIFSKCFLTELSDKPMPRQNGRWDFDKFKKSPRGEQMKNGNLGNFYKSFNKVVIYAGVNYTGAVGSLQREEIIKLFNPNLSNADIHIGTDQDGVNISQRYVSPNGGAEVIVTENHIITAMFNNSDTLGHDLGVMTIGDI